MATVADEGQRRPAGFAPDWYERLLSIGAVALMAVVLVALARGRPQWPAVPRGVWLHLATVLVALALTPVMLLRLRGDRLHRRLGKLWVTAMFLTALVSLFVRTSNPHGFSFVHLISAYVVIAAPLIWWTASTHRVRAHRRHVRGMVTGALLIAGFFTLPFGRLLGTWLLG